MYPKSEDSKIQLLSEILVSYLEKEEVKFTIEGADLYPQEVCGHFGCLPLFLLEAKDKYEKIFNLNLDMNDFAEAFGRSLGVLQQNEFSPEEKKITKIFPIEFLEDQEAYFDAIPLVYSPDNQSVSFVVLAHFTHYSIEEYINFYKSNPHLIIDGKIPLDTLYHKWKNARLTNKITIKPNTKLTNNNSNFNS